MEEIYRKKEGELRLAKQKESEWKRQPTKPKELKTEKAPETANPKNENQEQGHGDGNNG